MSMRIFEYRKPRYRADVPIIVHVSPQYSTCGRCTDVSAEGIGVRLAENLSTGHIVKVEFSLDGCMVKATARVEYCCDENYFGMKFQFTSTQEREYIARLMGSLQKIT